MVKSQGSTTDVVKIRNAESRQHIVPNTARIACIGHAEVYLAIGHDSRLPLAVFVQSLARIPEIFVKVG